MTDKTDLLPEGYVDGNPYWPCDLHNELTHHDGPCSCAAPPKPLPDVVSADKFVEQIAENRSRFVGGAPFRPLSEMVRERDTLIRQQAIDETLERIQDRIDEFGDCPSDCLCVITEYISLAQQRPERKITMIGTKNKVHIKFFEKSFTINGRVVWYNGGPEWKKQLTDAVNSVRDDGKEEGKIELQEKLQILLGLKGKS